MGKKRWLPIIAGLFLILLIAGVVFSLSSPSILEGKASAWLVQRISSTQDNFKESQLIRVVVEPADISLYRKILPEQFDMPEHPMVELVMIDQIDVGPWPLTPYQEGCVSLRCKYKGEEGWFITSLPVSKWVACYAGRTMGYPKYVADEVIFKQITKVWRGEVIHNCRKRLLLEFTPGEWVESPTWVKKGWNIDGPVLNLMPPGVGPDVVRIGSSSKVQPNTVEEKGMVRISIGPDEPWAGLVPPGTVAPGTFVKNKGGRSLVPEKKS